MAQIFQECYGDPFIKVVPEFYRRSIPIEWVMVMKV